MWNRKANRIADLEERLRVALTKREADPLTETATAVENRRLRADLAKTKADLKLTEDQLGDARKRTAILVDQLGARPTPIAELRDARRALMLSERARASLDEQLRVMQKANESMCLELAAASTTEAAR